MLYSRSSCFGASILAAGLILSACGTTPGDRAVSGGLLGAGTGALIGGAAGSAGTGALIGGLGGAAIGAATDPRDFNLGPPPWRTARGYRVERYASDDWLNYCSRRYRSFDPASGTYLGYDGYRHYCR